MIGALLQFLLIYHNGLELQLTVFNILPPSLHLTSGDLGFNVVFIIFYRSFKSLIIPHSLINILALSSALTQVKCCDGLVCLQFLLISQCP